MFSCRLSNLLFCQTFKLIFECVMSLTGKGENNKQD